MVLDLAKKTFFLVTGASRGIGKCMAIEVAKKLQAGSVIVLMARNQVALEKTKTEIESVRHDVTVLVYSVDLGKAKVEHFQELLSDSLKKSNTSSCDFEKAFIIHNAGTVGDVSKAAKDVTDTDVWSDYYHTNVFSTIALNGEFFKVFAQIPKLVINITSLCGIEPFASMSYYCSGKAAREMYFKVLAVEEQNTDTLVLNYAPGPIDTDMTIVIQKETINKDLQEAFKSQRDSKTMLTTEQTTKKFIHILEEVEFKSGAHIDYFD
ncbi:sepiapterin reductase-like [Musca vetustissima]|uniref:sepiapterin reductase-like n=1 Tax=Musca vetustissima TaxID=27455 RepID=UPI002AB6AC8B|nr:sepiapterin reductase-like [Musca vetustissima]